MRNKSINILEIKTFIFIFTIIFGCFNNHRGAESNLMKLLKLMNILLILINKILMMKNGHNKCQGLLLQ